MSFVLDCSMAVAFGLADELPANALEFRRIMPDDYTVKVPPLWWYEIANTIVTARKRGRLSRAQGNHLMELYSRLPVRTDIGVAGKVWLEYYRLASEHGLTAYDAAYLELAMRTGLKLASLDQRLLEVALKLGVEVFG